MRTKDPRRVRAVALGVVADAAVVAALLRSGFATIPERIVAALFVVALHVVPMVAGLSATAGIRSRYERVGLRSILVLACFAGTLLFLFTGIGQTISRGVLGRSIAGEFFGELAFLNQSAALLAGEIALVATSVFLGPRGRERGRNRGKLDPDDGSYDPRS